MDDYGFSSGLFSRLAHKILPQVPSEDSIEYFLAHSDNSISDVLAAVQANDDSYERISKELNLSIKALGAKVVAFGLDSKIKAHFDTLEVNLAPYDSVFEKLNRLSECTDEDVKVLANAFEETKSQIKFLRLNKNKIGTNLHLTVTTRRILEYIRRIHQLLDLKQNIVSETKWEKLLQEYIAYAKEEYSLRRFIIRHTDLLALEIVEHNAAKGEKYIADDRAEYFSFAKRSLLGGAIIAIFALIKINIDSFELSQINNALYYSINYALCFVLVKQFGGIIATKQPAVTASTLAKGIDKNDDLLIDSIQNITELVRSVSRSQFISVLGNFMMAILFAIALSFILTLLGFDRLTQTLNSEYLLNNTLPSASLVFYASVAGFFLAFSGLISGYIDNKLVASNIPYRIQKRVSFFKSAKLANYVDKKASVLIGNVSLGFFLGCAFLLSFILPFAVDIRHIAFSSANIGYSIMENDQTYKLIILAMSGALLIGFVNFIVSFLITLFIALKSRNAGLSLLPQIIKAVVLDFVKNPLAYYVFQKEK